MANVTSEQWAFVEETTSDFKVNIQILAEQRSDDEIEQHLVFWSIYLGVFAIEAFEGIVALIRAEKLRAAFMLSRALMEYHVRLRYYVLESAKLIAGMKAHPDVAVEHFYEQAQAIADWQSADAKMAALLRYRLKFLSDDDRAAVIKKLAEGETLHERTFTQMLKTVAKADPDIWDLAFAEFGTQSAFLHGDQAALTDAVEIENRRLKVHFDSPAISAGQLLAEASLFLTEMMESFERVHGWSYGGHCAKVRFKQLFEPTLTGAGEKSEAEEAAKATAKPAGNGGE